MKALALTSTFLLKKHTSSWIIKWKVVLANLNAQYQNTLVNMDFLIFLPKPCPSLPWPTKVGPYITCDDKCIGETSTAFGERFKEHLKDSSPIHHHSSNTGHPTTQKTPNNWGEGHDFARNIKESIFIKVNNPNLNKNIGKFNLPHIWDRVLLNSPGLTLKNVCLSGWKCYFQPT